jgi:hypothetical protein
VLILCRGRVAAHDSIEHLRESMHDFGHLTREHDHGAVANHILEVMQA